MQGDGPEREEKGSIVEVVRDCDASVRARSIIDCTFANCNLHPVAAAAAAAAVTVRAEEGKPGENGSERIRSLGHSRSTNAKRR